MSRFFLFSLCIFSLFFFVGCKTPWVAVHTHPGATLVDEYGYPVYVDSYYDPGVGHYVYGRYSGRTRRAYGHYGSNRFGYDHGNGSGAQSVNVNFDCGDPAPPSALHSRSNSGSFSERSRGTMQGSSGTIHMMNRGSFRQNAGTRTGSTRGTVQRSPQSQRLRFSRMR
ncbi:MAG: hypothetical protein COU08_00335 [Candidatus Harrisonbacteria bacterium CG10_big_fil_rev_8_21_14_0_10_42_17]|uniref:Secreted protein n=1 Tax=Candidatus Harrisonbacteria bacterium CG10_big_fil_rev_8_21_14_0_10_42_17 TaxID=1974584 RepID=A0A2M6WJ52_9BACT|nr:MAG: hypothetical protein COU08_00335 [Candidatus Harrisonbacteria bacterium CG10_big_fil_rev_8_21_14_0_10_42_17]